MQEPTTGNQYAPPLAEVDDATPDANEVAELRLFSPKGRIGRLRYLAYSTGATLAYYIVLSVMTGVLASASGPSSLLGGLIVVLWVALLGFSVIVGIKRCHDIGISGWWTATLIFPVIVLAWIFWPGNSGGNRFGPPPPPNNWGVRILGLIMPLAYIGIIVAVAIPAYQGYVAKAKAARQQQEQPLKPLSEAA